MRPDIHIKRVYNPTSKSDGYRILVDRLWPRGVTKEEADIQEWAKDLAPSPELRKWFGHLPEHWNGFKKKYMQELEDNPDVPEFLEQHKQQKLITLVYGAKDETHTHALVLQQYLMESYTNPGKT